MAKVDSKEKTRCLKRCERYLGLRRTGMPLSAFPFTDVDEPTPAPFERSVVFLAIDIEAEESSEHRISQVGISALDTQVLSGVGPGDHGVNWMKLARPRHYLVANESNVRGDYTPRNRFTGGDPAAFSLNETLEVTLSDMHSQIRAEFEGPFTAQTVPSRANRGRKPIVLVGHAVKNELEYLQQLGFDPRDHPQVIDVIDTQDLEQAVRRAPTSGNGSQPKKLEYIIEDRFGIRQNGKHNAGMDAYYTLQALVGLTLESAVQQISDQANPEWETQDDGGAPNVPRKSISEYLGYYAQK